MNRGDVYWYYGPATASEKTRKKRPVILVSINAANHNPSYPYVSVVPITSNVENIYSLEVDLGELLSKPSKAQPQLVFTCQKLDLSDKATTLLSWELLMDVDTRLKTYLGLE
jgi:mRNA-degrading endonuclease toxin of MazEF toxin-antitoxin module